MRSEKKKKSLSFIYDMYIILCTCFCTNKIRFLSDRAPNKIVEGKIFDLILANKLRLFFIKGILRSKAVIFIL